MPPLREITERMAAVPGMSGCIVSQADGYVLDGKAYSSLSAIARHITGAKWSGPRFFGLTKSRSA